MADGVDDIKALINATTREMRGGRCWVFHNWSKWHLSEAGDQQTRVCLRCGKTQWHMLRKPHEHNWLDKEAGNIMDGKTNKRVGSFAVQRCTRCGELRTVKTFT